VKSNDKKRGRLNAIRHVLHQFDYPGKDPAIATPPDPLIVGPASHAVDDDESAGAVATPVAADGHGGRDAQVALIRNRSACAAGR
jgi:hypothetical protein